MHVSGAMFPLCFQHVTGAMSVVHSLCKLTEAHCSLCCKVAANRYAATDLLLASSVVYLHL